MGQETDAPPASAGGVPTVVSYSGLKTEKELTSVVSTSPVVVIYYSTTEK